jgi:putative ABC transport system substrate-binding protein
MQSSQLNRREFITLLGGAAVAWPWAVRAQQATMPIVGLVGPRSPEESARLGAAFRKALNETGYIEAQNVMVEYYWLEGKYDRLPALMADLVRRPVAVIAMPAFTVAAPVAKSATTTIPIVFGVAEDPVKLGLVASLARPGGNATGINFLSSEMMAKRLGLFHDLVPKAVRIAVLINPANAPTAETTIRETSKAAHDLGLQIQILNASTSRESRRPSPPSCASAPMPSSSPPTVSSPAGASNLRRSRRIIDCPRLIPSASLSKWAG